MKITQEAPSFEGFEENAYGTKLYNERKLTKEDEILMKLYDSFEYDHPLIGDVKSIKYIGYNEEHFMFEGNFKDYVRVDNKPSESKFLKELPLGEIVDVLITETNEKVFSLKGSVSQIYTNKIHDELAVLPEGDFVIGTVKEMSPAGYSVLFTYHNVDMNGFMPNTLAGINRLSNPESMVGRTMELAIESYSKDEGTYIVSRRKYLQSLIPEAIAQLSYGDMFVGNVTGTTDFGVFVEFNECLTGMIHKSNLNPDNNLNINQIKSGMGIEFYIKEVVKNKIILTQVLKESLWDTVSPGMRLSGIVKDVKQFGTLVMLDGDTVGLIPMAELERIGKTFSSGQTVSVRVTAVDRMARKITLSI